jgi:acetyl-CoA synthetase
MTYGELEALTDQVAARLVTRGYRPLDAIAVIMPMTAESVAIYLGIIKAGCVVVGIPESFRPREIASRLRIANAVGVFTQDVVVRGGKIADLYGTLVEAHSPRTIVLSAGELLQANLRQGDLSWSDFLIEREPFQAVVSGPDDPINILFSSGTTGDPKAIPWTQTTPIKCTADSHFHQDVHPGDLLVWPTSLGWMMGPWLIFSSLLNRAAMGLYCGSPSTREFCRFVQDTRATLLGVVPTLVKAWRNTGCLEGLDWTSLKLFSSTGECSTPEDMRWLMQQAGNKPVIEYCGGTELGGAYITNTIARPCFAGTFNTPTLGLDFVILDNEGQPADTGELFIVPPSIGLSTTLLNRDHHEVYFADTPAGTAGQPLRRHGDLMEQIAPSQWRALGRADDTMNLSGIKVSSVEIEHVLRTVPGIEDIAAVAVSPGGGPSQLVIFAVVASEYREKSDQLLTSLQQAVRRDLNPLFNIHELVCVDLLPRTASNKLLRRTLRDGYSARESITVPTTPEVRSP